MIILEAKFSLDLQSSFMKDLGQLPRHYDKNYLDETIILLVNKVKLNKEYKYHRYKGSKSEIHCVHVPDPNACTKNKNGDLNKFSDWQLLYKIEGNTLKILRTGTQEHISPKKK